MSDKRSVTQTTARTTKPKNPFAALTRLSGRLYRAIGNSAIGRYMTGYDETCEKHKQSLFARLYRFKKHKKRFVNGYIAKQETLDEEITEAEREGLAMYKESGFARNWRNRFSAWFDSSWTVNLLRNVKDAVLYTPLVSYGVLIFAFALFMLITQSLTLVFATNGIEIPFLTHINSPDIVLIVTYMATAVVLMTTALLLIFAKDDSLIACLLEGRISGYVLRNFVGVRYHAPEKKRTRHNGKAFALGVSLGLITFFLPPAQFFKIIGALVLFSMIVCIPEFGLISLAILAPFCSGGNDASLSAVVILSLVIVSSLLKIMRGKRKFSFEPTDLYLVLFLMLVLFGGIVTMGGVASFRTAMTMILLAQIYFVITVLVRSEEWLNRCVNAFLLSSSVLSILGIAEWLLGVLRDRWQSTEYLSQVIEKFMDSWQTYDILSEYLAVSFLISFGCLLARKTFASKLGAFFTLAITSVYLGLSMATATWIVLALTVTVFFLLYSHKSLPWIVLGLVSVGLALVLVPRETLALVTDFLAVPGTSLQYRTEVWVGCSQLLRRCFLTGIGVGEHAFSEAYNGYAQLGMEAAPHSFNFLLQIMLQLGIFGALVFVVMVLMVMRCSFTLFRISSRKNAVSVTNLAFLISLLALLTLGTIDYIWQDYRIYVLFFAVVGMMVASARIGMNGKDLLQKELWTYDVDFSLGDKSLKKRSS